MTDYRLCDADEFRCNSGQCIPLKYKCKKSPDERIGCVDKSNLQNCSMLMIQISINIFFSLHVQCRVNSHQCNIRYYLY